MIWLIRAGAYVLSGLVVYQFVDGTGPAGFFSSARHLALDPDNAMVFGVCAGLSNYAGIDVSLIRLAWAIAAFYRGIGAGIYILAFLVMPMK